MWRFQKPPPQLGHQTGAFRRVPPSPRILQQRVLGGNRASPNEEWSPFGTGLEAGPQGAIRGGQRRGTRRGLPTRREQRQIGTGGAMELDEGEGPTARLDSGWRGDTFAVSARGGLVHSSNFVALPRRRQAAGPSIVHPDVVERNALLGAAIIQRLLHISAGVEPVSLEFFRLSSCLLRCGLLVEPYCISPGP
jgi:hypothetical protein